MKSLSERIRNRMRHDRPMTTISIRLPEDVIDDLKEISPMLGFSGYQPLIRSYIGQGLRDDLFKLQDSPYVNIAESLRNQGVADELIANAIAEAKQKVA